MKTRDRVISVVIVGGIIGAIWWGGSTLRSCVNGSAASDAAPSASASASAHAIPSASAAPTATAIASATIADASPPPPISGACKTMMDASTKKLADAKSCKNLDVSSLACKTSSNGATWGLRVDDVIDLKNGDACDTGFLVRLVHLDVNGAEAANVPGLSQTKLAHTYDVDAITRVGDVSFFDWDGDGEDEVFVRGARGAADHPIEERGVVWTFKNGIIPYAPAASLKIAGVRDIDSDGRPDLIVRFFAPSIPITHEFIAHSLADGTFTLHDSTAITFAEKQCPSDPKLDLTSKKPDDLDATVADDLACELLWGREPRALETEIAHVCKGAPCPAWAVELAKTKPPLSLR